MSQMRRASSFSTSRVQSYPLLSHVSQQGAGSSQSQDDVPLEPIKTVMYFVIPPGDTEENCLGRSLGEMYQRAEAHFLNVQWIKDEDCQDLPLECNGNILVFDCFDSPGFHYWEEHAATGAYKVELLGPQVLRYIFTSQEVLSFQTKSLPTYTLAMRSMIISLSGFKEPEKSDLEKKVKWMNGSISRTLTKAVTHVVTATALSDKSIEARKAQVPLMTAVWIREVWKDNQTAPVDASDAKYVIHACPIFYNINICLSQLSNTRKNTLKEAIDRFGGQCFADLVKETINVLVVTTPKGDKYKFAKRWKLPCVSPDWIESSTEQGRLLHPALFKVTEANDRPTIQTSTPAHSIMPDWNMNDTRCSDIVEPSRLVVNETNETNTLLECQQRQYIVEQIKSIKATGYLDGLRIFVVDYEKNVELKRTINLSGAVRHDQLCDGVTHVIVPGQKVPKSIQRKIQELDPIPSLVTIEWVLQSAQQRSPADDEEFKFYETNPPNVSIGMRESNVARVSATRNDTMCTRESAVLAAGGGMLQNNNDADAVSAFVEPSSVSNRSDDEESNDETQDTDNNGDETSVQDGSTTNAGDESASSSNLLVGITFYIGIENKEEFTYIKELIEDREGKIKKENADVAILPPVCKPSDMDKGDKTFTKYWLFDCLERESLDLEDVFYYKPNPSFKKMGGILKNVVIAVSQYPSIPRTYITELVIAMGGIYQEVFTRKDAPDLSSVKSTHLICKNMVNDKARAAKRWNVPVVVMDWVLSCFSEKKHVSESCYDPAVQPSTSDERTMFMPTPRRSTARTSNTSMRSVYPPSTTKAAPVTAIAKKVTVSNPMPPPAPVMPMPDRDRSRSPTNVDVQNLSPVAGPSRALNDNGNRSTEENHEDLNVTPGGGDVTFDSLRAFEEESNRKIAELKAQFPYSDESLEQLYQSIKDRGVNLEDVSPFTSFEERRMGNLSTSSSPLLFGLPRKESRMLREQVEIALSCSPTRPNVKWKTPKSTPMSEIVRRFNALQKSTSSESDSRSPDESPRTSTPKSDGQKLRKIAAINRLSFGNEERPTTSTTTDALPQPELESYAIEGIEGIRRLEIGNKRPSDGSPGEEAKSTKRARSSEEDGQEGEEKKSLSPTENVLPGFVGLETNEMPSTSKTANKMQLLTNLIAKSQANCPENGSLSPTKRKSGDASPIIIPCINENVQEEVERPHLSWVDDEGDQENKQLVTVRRQGSRRRIPSVTESATEETEAEGGRKRSSRVKKGSLEVEEPKRETRRTRSRSKTRKEGTAPYGHQPMTSEDVESTSTKQTFPRHLGRRPVFILSSLNPEEKSFAFDVITRLGGSVSSLAYYDPECTALVTKTLLRSEKVLGCIAAGKYLLKYEYLLKCEEGQQFIPVDETYIWHEGNINIAKEKDIAKYSFNWLKAQFKDKNARPMSGKKFYFVGQAKERLPAYTRLIAAGGGEVVESLDEANVVIGEEKISLPRGVEQYGVLYLNNLVLSDPPSN